MFYHRHIDVLKDQKSTYVRSDVVELLTLPQNDCIMYVQNDDTLPDL